MRIKICIFFLATILCLNSFGQKKIKITAQTPNKKSDMRMSLEYMKTKDPATGIISKEKLVRAHEDAKNKKNRNIVAGGISTLNFSASLIPTLNLSWTERGPYTDLTGPSNGNYRGADYLTASTAGRVRAIWPDLADATGKTVWAAGVDGGLWKTTDITVSPANWVAVDDDQFNNLAIISIAQDPTNTNTLYAGTGESFMGNGGGKPTANAVKGVGVFKSIDHGVTWSLLSSTSTSPFSYITKIICGSNGYVYLATTRTADDVTIADNQGHLRRSTDGGATWTIITPITALQGYAYYGISDIEMSSTGRLHVASGMMGGPQYYAYTDAPATATQSTPWSTAVTPFPNYTTTTDYRYRVELAVNGNTLYALPVKASTLNADVIYKSTDGGANWAATAGQIPSGTPLTNGQAYYDLAIAINPSNADECIVGGLDNWKTTDGGTTWNKVSTWVGTTGQYVHADMHNLTWYDSGNKLLFGSDGGVFYSGDKGVTIKDRNNGLRIKQFYSAAIHPTATNYFLAGAQDNGTHKLNAAGLASSVEVQGGDGGFVAIDQTEPGFQFGTYVYGGFRRSLDGGASWSSVNFNAGTSSAAPANMGQFINAYALDDSSETIYAGAAAGSFFRWTTATTTAATTGGTSYYMGGTPPTGASIVSGITNFGGGQVSAVKISPYTLNRVFFGTTTGKIVRIDDAYTAANNPTTVNITPSAMTGIAAYTSSINIGTTDNNIIACYSNYGVSSIWVSTDAGTNWTTIDGNLADMPVRWAMFYPGDNNKAIVATETGVWITDLINGTSTVWTSNTTFPSVRTDMLAYRSSDRTLVAATHGRGLFSTTLPDLSCTPASSTISAASSTVCSGSGTSLSLSTAYNELAYTFQWSSSATSGGIFSNLLTAATQATGNLTATTYYKCTITCTASGVTYTTAEQAVTVTALATATAGGPNTVCQAASPTAFALAGASVGGSATTGAWSIVSGGGTLSSTAQTATPASVTYTPAANFTGIVTLRLTSNAGTGCTAVSVDRTITVTASNTATLSSAVGTDSQTKCINTAITNITYTTSGATGASFSGLPTGVSGSWSSNVVTISGTPSASGTANYTVTLTGGCGTVTATGSITVTENNTVTLSSAAGTNAQTKCINTAITNITYTTSGATGASFSGLPTGVSGSWSSNVVTISGTPTVAGTSNYTVTLTGGCGTVTATGSITVTANNTLTLSSAVGTNAQTTCVNSAITNITYTTTVATGASFSGLPTGISGAWASNVVTISGAPSASGTSNYTVTLTGGCGTVTATGSITVTANNTVTLSSAAGTSDQTKCINTAITNITYTTSGATGASFSGLPTGVSGSWSSNVVTISGTPTVAGTSNYTVTLTGGCGTVTATGSITVTENNTVTLSSAAGTNAQTKCINTSITNITYTTTGATGASFSGLPTGVSGSWLSNVVTISGSSSVAGTSNYTVTLTGGCGMVTTTGSIVVNAAPVATAGGPNTVCLSASPVAFALAGASVGGSATTGAWSIVSGGGTLSSTAQTATPESVTYTPAANFSGTVTLRLTSNAGTGCTAVSVDRTVTVTASLPASVSIASSDADNIICAGTSVTFTATPTNGGLSPSYQWKLNGFDILNEINATYTGTLSNNDIITVEMTSNATPCLVGSPALAIGITTTVNNCNQTRSAVLSLQAGDETICNGNLAHLIVTVTGTGLFSGMINGTIPFESYESPINVPVEPGETTTYTITAISDATGPIDAGQISGQVQVIVNDCNQTRSAVLSLQAGDETICNGNLAHLIITATGTGLFSGMINGTIPFESYESPINVPVEPGETTTYTITAISDATGPIDAGQISGQVQVIVNDCNQTRSAVLSLQAGDETICKNDMAHLIITATGTGPFSGKINGTIPFEGNTSPINVPVEPGQTTTYTITEISDASGLFNANQITGSATVSVSPALSPIIIANGPTTLCEGQSVELSVNLDNKRFATSVVSVSSEYDECGFDFSSCQILGKPDTYPAYGDLPYAWSPFTEDNNNEFIELGFDANKAAPINFIDIYETFGAGSIDGVFVKNPSTGLFERIYTATAGSIGNVSRILHIPFNTTSFNVSEIRIEMNSAAVEGYNEIDAVAIGLSSNGYTYSWSNGATTGLSLNPSFNVNASGNYSVSITNNGCTETSLVKVVTVNTRPTAVLTLVGNDKICTGSETTLRIDITGENTGLWSGTLSDGTPFESATSPIIIHITPVVNTDYTIATLTGGICETADLSGNASITVNEIPSAEISGTAAICKGSSTDLTITILGDGTGPWSGTITGGIPFSSDQPTITIPVSPTSNTIYSITSFKGLNCTSNNFSGTADITVTARPTAVLSGGGNLCAGSSKELSIAVTGEGTGPWTGELSDGTPFEGEGSPIIVYIDPIINTTYTIKSLSRGGCDANLTDLSGIAVVTVREVPSAIITGDASICAGTETELTITITGEGTGPWFGAISDGINLIDFFSSSENIIKVPVTPDGSKTYYIESFNGEYCESNDFSGIATVNILEKPSATISGDVSICKGSEATLLIDIIGEGTGPWSGILSDGTTFSGGENPIEVIVKPTVTRSYTITSLEGENCIATDLTGTVIVTVNELPTANISYNSPFCAKGVATVTQTGQPDGLYSSKLGLDIDPNTGEIDLATSTPGSYEVTYTFTAGNCENITKTSVIINALPVVTFGSTLDNQCISSTIYTLTGGLPSGGTYSGEGVMLDGNFNASIAGVGSHTITYTFTDPITGCTNTATNTIVVKPLPVVTFDATLESQCVTSTTYALTGGLPLGGTYSGEGVMLDGNFNASIAGVGSHTITYTFTDPITGCTNTATNTIVVNQLPVVTFIGTLQSQCVTSTTYALTGGLPLGGTYSGEGVNNVGNFDASIVGVGSYTITYTFTDPITGCTNTATNTIVVNPLPVVTFDATLESQCVTSTIYALTGGLPSGGTYSGVGVNGGNFNASIAGVGTHIITYTFTDLITGCTNAATNTIVVKPTPAIAAITGINNICIGSTTTFANAYPSGIWTSASPQIAQVNSVTGVITSQAVGSSVISYTITENGCSSTATRSVMISDIPAAPLANGATICGSGSVTLTATAPSRGTVAWYDVATLGTPLATTTSYVTPVITASRTYYVESKTTASGCVSATRTPVLASVVTPPLEPTVTPGARCGTGTVVLTATPPIGATLAWFSSLTSTTVLTTASSYTTPSISVSTTYYVESRVGTTCVSARVPVVATIASTPATATTPVNGSVCGSGVVTLSATAPTGVTVDWYDAATGGNLLQSGTVAGVNSYTKTSLSATKLYYAQARNILAGCLSASRLTVTATVNALPLAPAATGATRCGTGTLVLTSTEPTGGTVAWYELEVGGTALATTTSYTTASISATKIYYVASRITATGCVSATRTPVTATITATPALPTASDVSRCGTGTVVLTATPPTGATVAWFAAPSGGTALSTANPYTTASISTTRDYFVESRFGTTCVSSRRTIVRATVNPIPATPTGTGASRCGPGVVTISATTAVAGAIIEWYETNTSTAVLGTGNNFTTPSITATTTYYAAARSGAGCISTTRRSVVATINPLLAASASITGTTTVCPIVGTTTTTNYTAAIVSGASTYKWTVPAGAVITSALTGRTITVRFNSLATGDAITVQGVASNGCAGNPKTLALTTTPCAPPVLLTSANTNNIKAVPVVESLTVKVFPNPSNTLFNLNVTSSSTEKVQVRMLDARGSILKTTTINPSNTLRIGEELRPGVYMFEVRQGANTKVVKVIKF